MTRKNLAISACLLSGLFASGDCSAEDFLLYTPKAAEADQVPAAPDQGVLVRKVIVKKGDTLKKLSREYLGRSSWFPQVLVFNTIKNPDRIQVGDKVMVPVPPGKSAVKAESGGEKGGKAGKGNARRHAEGLRVQREHGDEVRAYAPVKAEKPAGSPLLAVEEASYQQARRAYIAGNYQQSLEQFTAFLRQYPNSPFAADAALYRADCFLRLSGK